VSVGRDAVRRGSGLDLGALHKKVNEFFALQHRHIDACVNARFGYHGYSNLTQ
jgi:hypothetical protein